MMTLAQLLETYLDASFVEYFGDMAAAVGIGIVIGFVAVVLAWVLGLIVKLGLEA